MRKIFTLIFLAGLSLTVAPACSTSRVAVMVPRPVYTGIDVLEQNNFALLKGKRVGLITNATGVNRQLRSTIDILNEAPGVELTALFGPEHGVRGDISAGEMVETYLDERTGVTVYSLYGKTRKPESEMLKDVDVLVYDIQDIGVRSYTFISTMGLAMEAAHENGIEFMVLDRPNPLGGFRIEGNVTEKEHFTFISRYPIPYVYGLTSGELARLLNGEGMLANGVQADLTVIPMEGWQRWMTFEQTGLPWVPASPHIPHAASAFYYVASGILGELGVVSEGVGYTIPFEVYAADWINGNELADKMNSYRLPGVIFRPLSLKPYYGRDEGKNLHGVQIHITDYRAVHLMELQFWFLQANNELYPEKNPFKLAAPGRLPVFDNVAGSAEVRRLFTKNFKVSDIQHYLRKDAEAFKRISDKYYLYK